MHSLEIQMNENCLQDFPLQSPESCVSLNNVLNISVADNYKNYKNVMYNNSLIQASGYGQHGQKILKYGSGIFLSQRQCLPHLPPPQRTKIILKKKVTFINFTCNSHKDSEVQYELLDSCCRSYFLTFYHVFRQIHHECSNNAKKMQKYLRTTHSKESMLLIFQKNKKFLYSAGERGRFHNTQPTYKMISKNNST